MTIASQNQIRRTIEVVSAILTRIAAPTALMSNILTDETMNLQNCRLASAARVLLCGESPPLPAGLFVQRTEETMMNICAILSALALICISINVRAAGRECRACRSGSHTLGDGLLTFDTNTGLEWLDLSASTGTSPLSVHSAHGNRRARTRHAGFADDESGRAGSNHRRRRSCIGATPDRDAIEYLPKRLH